MCGSGDGAVFTCTHDGMLSMWDDDTTLLWCLDISTACECNEYDVAMFNMALELDCVCMGMSSGELIVIPVEEQGRRVEEVGCVEGGIVAGEWSPDGETIGIIGGYGQLILMNSNWDVMMETNVFSVDCVYPQPTAKPETDVVEALSHGNQLRRLKYGDACISWRGDGKYVATCARLEGDGPGRIRIWDVENQELHAIGEQSPGTRPVISWQPNGRVLCVVNYLHEDIDEVGLLRQGTREQGAQGQAPEVRHVGAWKRELKRRKEAAMARGEEFGPSRIFLYERNGLQHGEFFLPGDSAVTYMEWSSDSTMLGLILRRFSAPGVVEQEVQVWHRSNWKWYMKFSRSISVLAHVSICWLDTMDGTFLCIMASDGIMTRLRFGWKYNTSQFGTVGVIDGTSVLVTPMRHCMIPPPLCAIEASCPLPVVALSFSMKDSDECIAALLADGSMCVFKCEEQDDWEMMASQDTASPESDTVPLTPKASPVVTMIRNESERHYRHIQWLIGSRLVLVGQTKEGEDVVVQYQVDWDTRELQYMFSIPCPCDVVDIIGSPAGDFVIIQSNKGKCYRYDGDGHVQSAWASFGEVCEQSACAPLKDDSVALVGLDKKGRLYFDGHVISGEVTSFGLHYSSAGGPHILYTLRSSAIRTLAVDALKTGMAPPIKEGDATLRAIEDGCLIVTSPAASVDVILQAPRGNLEVIRPRALVLPAVAQSLDDQDYRRAWSLATINRLDLNVIADYKWPRIVETIQHFMTCVDSDTDVSGFLQALTPDSVVATNGLYNSCFISSESQQDPRKVEIICNAIRTCIQHIEDDNLRRKWLCTELTTYSKCDNLGAALARVKEVKEEDLEIIEKKGLDHAPKISAETGLKHILLYTPEQEVYKAALGEYELEMAYMVITHSQRDPGEYLVELQQFAAISKDSLRYAAIDKYLERYDRALRHLVDAGEDYFNDALILAKEQKLLRLLLSYTSTHEQRKIVHCTMGDELSIKGKYEDAAVCFAAGEDLENALRSYRLAGAWRPALTLAARLGKDEASIRSIVTRMANDLEEAHSFEDAARVQLEYLKDVQKSVALYARGGNWREALRVAMTLGHPEYMDSILSPAAAEAAARLLEMFKEDHDRVDKYWNRLKELRERRSAMDAMKAAADAEARAKGLDMDRDNDLESEAASAVTGLSIYTEASLAQSTATGTSMASTIGGRKGGQFPKHGNKGKQKKKKKIRRGSPEEEAELGNHILSLLPLPSVCTEIGQLAEFLILIGHEDDAFILQNALKDLIDIQSRAAQDILEHPPPGKELLIPDSVRFTVFEKSGLDALMAMDEALSTLAGPQLQVQIKDSETSMKNIHWKWELLRPHEG